MQHSPRPISTFHGADPSLAALHGELRACRRCPRMIGPVVHGAPVESPIYLLGQAPGPREGQLGRPFAWTAGKTLFRWFSELGPDEEEFRARVYIAAVARCFPGKVPGGGDRVPDEEEIASCQSWIARELALLRPRLILPVGRLAVFQVLGKKPVPLVEVVGRRFHLDFHGHEVDVIPLPHPSGASTWHRVEPGISLTRKALRSVARHPAWRETFARRRPARP